MRSTRQQSEARWGSLRQTILLLSHELLVIIDRRPRSDLLFCAKHLFVTAIVTGPRGEGNRFPDGVRLEGPSPDQGYD